MSEIRLNYCRLATRCEICHQSDCFDGLSETCTRCANLVLTDDGLEETFIQASRRRDRTNWGLVLGALFGCLAGCTGEYLKGASMLSSASVYAEFGVTLVGAILGAILVAGIELNKD